MSVLSSKKHMERSLPQCADHLDNNRCYLTHTVCHNVHDTVLQQAMLCKLAGSGVRWELGEGGGKLERGIPGGGGGGASAYQEVI